jgi:enamine deaminase RidA (YjgF/YER057c/UK114 family)
MARTDGPGRVQRHDGTASSAWRLRRLSPLRWPGETGILACMTAPVTLVRADRLYQGVPYAYASVAPSCALVFTAGACPLDENGLIIGAGDVRIQARQAVANLAETLAAAGAGLTDVLKTTVYVASSDRSDLVAAWEVVRAAFADHDAPSTLLGVAVLGYADQLVEVEAVAVAGRAGPAQQTLDGWAGSHPVG